MNDLSFGQRIDPQNGLVECWFTHPALDEIKSWDLSDKVIWMFGAGRGDAWLGKRCKRLYIVERDKEWLDRSEAMCKANGLDNVVYKYCPCNDSSGEDGRYTRLIDGIDIIINDDAYRYEVCVKAVEYFKKNGGGILISDNWKQSYVWLSPKSEEVMESFEAHIHEQSDHTDNDGVNKWKTAIHFIK